jgi:hypothetical protein
MIDTAGKATAGNAGSRNGWRGRRWRTVYWAAAVLLLLVPLVAMQFTGEVRWTVFDFVFAGALFFVVGVTYEAAVRDTDNAAHRWAVRLALGTGFALVWVTGAVGIIGSEANAVNVLYYGVLAIAAAGAVVAHFRPRGMARAMAATALAQAAVATGALVAGWMGTSGPFEVVAINGVFVALWIGSAVLFRRAAWEQAPADTGPEK